MQAPFNRELEYYEGNLYPVVDVLQLIREDKMMMARLKEKHLKTALYPF